jgi:hypothetical protein
MREREWTHWVVKHFQNLPSFPIVDTLAFPRPSLSAFGECERETGDSAACYAPSTVTIRTSELQSAYASYQQVPLPTFPASECFNLMIFWRDAFLSRYYLNFPLPNSILLFTPMIISLYTRNQYQQPLCLFSIFRCDLVCLYSQMV